MTFKPESTSSLLLNQLDNRRLTELLAEHIPEDEAKLLSNGRYTCMVCDNRPIFDTLAVLSQHRVGKKHRFYLARFMAKKDEIETLIIKRKQEASLKGKTYEVPATQEHDKVLGQAAHGLLKTASTYESRNKFKVKPYSRKQIINYEKEEKTNTQQTCSQEKQSNPKTQVNRYIRQAQRKRDFTDVVDAKRRLHITPQTSQEPRQPKPTQSNEYEKLSNVPETQTDVERAKYYQNLRASGWKKDLMGNWVRDDDVEFDSDEEPPSEYKNVVKG